MMVPKQFPPVELSATIVFFNVTVPCELPMPLPHLALLPEKVLLLMISVLW